MLIIARAGDALSMKNDSGEDAQDVAEGYEIKMHQALDALDREHLPAIEMSLIEPLLRTTGEGLEAALK